jgi:ribosomal protein S18 acetylase RimI-like enzyme
VRFAEPTVSPRVLPWTSEQFAERIDEAMTIYVAAMEYSPSAGHQRALTARNHVHIDGFACRAAVLDDGTLVGFGYGYSTAKGQWWHDLVRRALTPEVAGRWLEGAFELSELHMLPSYQGRGIGREILLQLADSIPHKTMLLSTPDADTRAFRLYHRLGFIDLRRNYLFPGDSRPFAVLGAQLPLRPDDGR